MSKPRRKIEFLSSNMSRLMWISELQYVKAYAYANDVYANAYANAKCLCLCQCVYALAQNLFRVFPGIIWLFQDSSV